MVKAKYLLYKENCRRIETSMMREKKPDVWNSDEKIIHYFHSYPVRLCCKVSCFSLSACLPKLRGLKSSWFECSGVTPHFVIPNERKVPVLHLSSGRLIFFRLISSWEITWRSHQRTLHYFEEDIITWLFWNKNNSFEKKYLSNKVDELPVSRKLYQKEIHSI